MAGARSWAVFPLLLCWVVLTTAPVVAAAAPPFKMRPYAGIGLVSSGSLQEGENEEPLHLYEEPANARLMSLDLAKVPRYDWIFGANRELYLIVASRKGKWLRVAYDEAGREAWLMPRRSSVFLSWEMFLKGRTARMLPGLQKRYYQVYQQPGSTASVSLPPGQFFKVLRLEGDWAMVMPDQRSIGWVRWRDEDGRLLVGLEG